MDSAAPNLTVGTEADAPDIAALMNLAGVLDLIHAAADEIERSRHLPDAVVAALRGTGINRLSSLRHVTARHWRAQFLCH